MVRIWTQLGLFKGASGDCKDFFIFSDSDDNGNSDTSDSDEDSDGIEKRAEIGTKDSK